MNTITPVGENCRYRNVPLDDIYMLTLITTCLRQISFVVVDPTGFAPASLRVKGRMLLHTPQAQIHHDYYDKTKESLFQGILLFDTQQTHNV